MSTPNEPDSREEGQTVEVVDHPEAGRYELRHDGELVGVVDYRIDGHIFTIPHVEVIPRLRGGGHSAPFLDKVLDEVAARDLHVRPLCGYAAGHIRQRPDRDRLLA